MATSLARVSLEEHHRHALEAGTAFLEGSASPSWGIEDLRSWMSEHIVRPGYMAMPTLVTEPSAGTVALFSEPVHAQRLRLIVVAARSRVLTGLRGLAASPSDDRFLTASIFAGRVTRRASTSGARWVPTPDSATPLSGVVLSVFAADVLSHRETYGDFFDECTRCNRTTFHGGRVRRCLEHEPRISGVYRKIGVSHVEETSESAPSPSARAAASARSAR